MSKSPIVRCARYSLMASSCVCTTAGSAVTVCATRALRIASLSGRGAGTRRCGCATCARLWGDKYAIRRTELLDTPVTHTWHTHLAHLSYTLATHTHVTHTWCTLNTLLLHICPTHMSHTLHTCRTHTCHTHLPHSPAPLIWHTHTHTHTYTHLHTHLHTCRTHMPHTPAAHTPTTHTPTTHTSGTHTCPAHTIVRELRNNGEGVVSAAVVSQLWQRLTFIPASTCIARAVTVFSSDWLA